MVKHLGTSTLAVGLALALMSSAQAAPNIMVSGGELDGRITSADVYVGVPKEAPVPASPACRMAKRYLAFITSGEVGKIADLFEPDAVHMGALGSYLRGHDEINKFFIDVIGPLKSPVIPVTYAGNGPDCLVAVAVSQKIDGQPRWVLKVVDHFTLGRSGKISREVAYPRPDRK
jgi:hypothetical protein